VDESKQIWKYPAEVAAAPCYNPQSPAERCARGRPLVARISVASVLVRTFSRGNHTLETASYCKAREKPRYQRFKTRVELQATSRCSSRATCALPTQGYHSLSAISHQLSLEKPTIRLVWPRSSIQVGGSSCS